MAGPTYANIREMVSNIENRIKNDLRVMNSKVSERMIE